MMLSVSNNNYILNPGDLVKVIKKVEYVYGQTINVNSLYLVKETWNETSGDIVLKNSDPNKNDFVLSPSYVDKVLNYKKSIKQKEAA